jgi:hypothetical protein
MSLHLNLLHEEIYEQRQRQRDPLKLGFYALAAIGVLMFAWYSWNAYEVLQIKSRLGAVERDWAKVEPKVTAAQTRSAELNGIVGTTKVLDGMIEGRFFWAPFLEKVSRCVAPNAQLTSLDGTADETKGVAVSIEGVASGREPRAAAEELRQTLLDQLGETYKDVKAEFKTLEDLDTLADVGGAKMPTARFIVTITFNPSSNAAKAAAPARVRAPKNEAKQTD